MKYSITHLIDLFCPFWYTDLCVVHQGWQHYKHILAPKTTYKIVSSTLEFDVDSKKQSLLPNPSAARHNFCCSLWTVAVHCRTTSSSFQKKKKIQNQWLYFWLEEVHTKSLLKIRNSYPWTQAELHLSIILILWLEKVGKTMKIILIPIHVFFLFTHPRNKNQ